jgi:transglutaminase-like putative cysteine protease
MSTNLKWTYSDYVRRTPAQILERGEGICADLASVLAALLVESKVPYRWVGEINIQPRSDSRLASSRRAWSE